MGREHRLGLTDGRLFLALAGEASVRSNLAAPTRLAGACLSLAWAATPNPIPWSRHAWHDGPGLHFCGRWPEAVESGSVRERQGVLRFRCVGANHHYGQRTMAKSWR